MHCEGLLYDSFKCAHNDNQGFFLPSCFHFMGHPKLSVTSFCHLRQQHFSFQESQWIHVVPAWQKEPAQEHCSELSIKCLRVKAGPSCLNSTLPLCLRRKSMLFCRMVDLSILRVDPGSMLPSSLMSTLNWSLRFFSDLFRLFLRVGESVPLKSWFYSSLS